MRSKNILSIIAILLSVAFSVPTLAATYTYDNANRLTGVDNGDSAITYTYDANGNLASMTVIDKLAPTGTILINNGATATSDPSVTLTISATDNNGTVSQMRFSPAGWVSEA